MATFKNQESVFCPALFVTAPASGQGKTTITSALARMLKRQGKVVRVFKTGPDFLDPQILAQASGEHVEQLDLWMAGENYCRYQFYQAAKEADLIIVEGAMGMFDGEPSSADLAATFNIPMAIVMDVKGMAQTAAAIAMGLANFRDDVQVAGLIANSCSTERHRQLIEDALPASLPLLATLERSELVALPERHLGLVQASEVRDELEQRFEAGADWLVEAGLENILKRFANVEFKFAELPIAEPYLKNKVVAIAKDDAFSFIYQANLLILKELGAEVKFFSPLQDAVIPEADALWLPGGYPELHAQKLAENFSMLKSMKEFSDAQKPILAECGGFLYCLEDLTDLNDETHVMASILAGQGAMKGKRGCQGMQTAIFPEGEVRAHAHHRSRSFNLPEALSHGRRQRHPAPGEAIYRHNNLNASYLHLFFPSNPKAISCLFNPELTNAATV
ncbi:MAG: cobyrinic acid a,c-diamide synthase [Oleispira sp.]|jgi:cobyrinic acid a,c-diamide synthase